MSKASTARSECALLRSPNLAAWGSTVFRRLIDQLLASAPALSENRGPGAFMRMNKVELLRRAEAILSGPASWTQGEFSVLPVRGGAFCGCLDGALRSATWERHAEASAFCFHPSNARAYDGAVELLVRVMPQAGDGGVRSLWAWNDAAGRTFAEVRALVRKAIEAGELEGLGRPRALPGQLGRRL